jgi:hypothetical protein
VDIVLLVIGVELIVLVGAGWRVGEALLRLGPGVMLLLAVRGALIGLDWRWIALPLLLSLPIHLADLARARG